MLSHGLQLILVVWMMRMNPTEGIKILMIPVNTKTHILYFTRLGEGLSRLGHTVQLIVPSNSGANQPSASDLNFTLITYGIPEISVPYFATVEISPKRYYDLTEMESECQHLLNNKRLMKKIRAVNFDFAIMDAFVMQCYYVIPYSLDIPYAAFSVARHTWQYRVPRSPSFSSGLGYTDVMTFRERFASLIAEATALFEEKTENSTYMEKYAPHKPVIGVDELITRCSLWLYVEDIALAHANPHMPNTLSVGDILIGQPVHNLTKELEQFIADTPEGGSVIVVSLGSFLDYLPQEWIENLCDVFRRFKTHRFIWKLKYRYSIRAPNILALPWIPQNDLLAEKRVHLFISHGGYSSLLEAVYHAKPVIVFPVEHDQRSNAVIAEFKGIGIRMDLKTFTADELYNNIVIMLTFPNNYSATVRRASAILRDKPDGGAAQRVSNMIKHVLKHGDAHLRTGAFQLNIVQYFMFDLFAFILITFLLLIIIWTLSFCSFCCRYRPIRENSIILTSNMVISSYWCQLEKETKLHFYRLKKHN